MDLDLGRRSIVEWAESAPEKGGGDFVPAENKFAVGGGWSCWRASDSSAGPALRHDATRESGRETLGGHGNSSIRRA